MAGDFLKRKAEEQAKIIDEKYGEGKYGGTAYLKSKIEEAQKTSATEKSSSTKSGGAKTDKSTGKTGDWLKNKVAESSALSAGNPSANRSYALTLNGENFGVISQGGYDALQGGRLDNYTPKNEEEKNTINTFRQASSIPLKAQDGADFGKISYDAYAAIIRNNIDNYTPKNEVEKKALSDFKAYAGKQSRINSNPVYAKYNIDPLEFDRKGLEQWAEERNFELNLYCYLLSNLKIQLMILSYQHNNLLNHCLHYHTHNSLHRIQKYNFHQ